MKGFAYVGFPPAVDGGEAKTFMRSDASFMTGVQRVELHPFGACA